MYLDWPIYPALLRPNLFFDLPPFFALMVGLAFAFNVLILFQIWFVAPVIIVLAVGRRLAKRDPYFFDFLMTAFKCKSLNKEYL
jgi:type IV secretory pathway VirB3-like protein